MSRLNSFFSLLLVVLVALISSCNSNEIGDVDDVNPENIYFDYKISGEEGDPDVTVMLQFRYAGPNGTTLLLKDPSKVELDGKLIPGDSSRMTGAYYEMIIPVSQFTGPHSIRFTDVNGKTYDEKFEFRPLKFQSAIPDTIHRSDMEILLEGLAETDVVRLIMTDTSFSSDGINRLDSISNGRLLITKQELGSLVNGPISLQIYRETERNVNQRTLEGGMLSITYALKREIFLKD